ncbi:MAG: hypothetical protein O3A01_00370 [bacterium]|nr:hypothetical protein [bacterium]
MHNLADIAAGAAVATPQASSGRHLEPPSQHHQTSLAHTHSGSRPAQQGHYRAEQVATHKNAGIDGAVDFNATTLVSPGVSPASSPRTPRKAEFTTTSGQTVYVRSVAGSLDDLRGADLGGTVALTPNAARELAKLARQIAAEKGASAPETPPHAEATPTKLPPGHPPARRPLQPELRRADDRHVRFNIPEGQGPGESPNGTA